jgi:hypothetical protein
MQRTPKPRAKATQTEIIDDSLQKYIKALKI